MSRAVSNVDIVYDTFEVFILKTNEVLNAISNEVITANSTYANTGNTVFYRTAQLYGTFGANNIVVSDSIRGGNVNGLFTDLKVSTNVAISNTSAANLNISVSNSSSISYINPHGAVFGNSNIFSVSNNSVIGIYNSSANTKTQITPIYVSVGNTTNSSNISSSDIKSGNFTVNSTAIHYGSNVSIGLSEVNLTGNTSQGNTSISAESSLHGNSTYYAKHDKSGYEIVSTAGVSKYNNLGFDFSGVMSLVTNVINDIGTNSAPREIFSFNKNDFRSGKLQVQIVNGSTTQVSEILLSHNGTEVNITTYGSVSSPASTTSTSPLGVFSTTIAGSTVTLLLDQVISNSDVRTIAQMIV